MILLVINYFDNDKIGFSFLVGEVGSEMMEEIKGQEPHLKCMVVCLLAFVNVSFLHYAKEGVDFQCF